ncbi:PBSX family phage terminase large subunit [Streptococcus suis]|uniref:PBSX family phage terminase large subunit n=1 Tax=Streptococcus suis TaxID=1307 RepID=UPI00041FE437|nr:PBSX family phage terminase large subunit [Streptococcus suis]QBX30552.1 terminase large subunit [Streptococcus phage Javan554]MCH1644378.1 PBSX family phage terminase large subunit [Streptococcus suis]NQI84033.1 PBSX family phage terminase large subunit [Streptococcus suis]NQK18091.1 PBSX family phage terminase large subunit [Streptococcus suis]HEL2309196.1 PBSX family phage terminase large subunit [Streptococcus suis]
MAKSSLSTAGPTIDIQRNVNPHFKPVWTSKKPYNILKGGRNSFKSSVIALLLVYKMLLAILKKQTVEIIIVRKVANTIYDSVYKKIEWALRKFGVHNQFRMYKSPFKITHKKTGSTFHFYGQDDFQKLKSNEVGAVIAVWYEEAAEFNSAEEFDQSNSTFMRQKHPDYPYVQFFWSYNPPRNPYAWINEWLDSLRGHDKYLIHESSYLNDELDFVTEQMLDEIERIKQNDYDYYRYLYLGEPVGLGTNVYNLDLFHVVDGIPQDERVVYQYFSIDGGHQQSATTCLHIVLTSSRKVFVIDNYYYSPAGKVNKKSPSQLSKDLHEFIMEKSIKRVPGAVLRNQTIDSAEGALRNEYYERFKVRLNPVKKKTKIIMTEYVQSLLAQDRIYVVRSENNMKFFMEEHKRYMWDEKTVMSDNPAVVKTDDHTCDAFQYFVMDNLRDLGLIA